MVFRTPDQDASAIPTFGGQTLIVAKRTGLLLSVEEALGSDEVSSYSDAGGAQAVTFNDIRKYSAVLMAFPIKAAVQPYLGVGYGIMHAVDPTATGLTGSDGIANELGSTGFATLPRRRHLPGRSVHGLRPVPDHHLAVGRHGRGCRWQRRGGGAPARRARPTRLPAGFASALAARVKE